MSFRLYLLFFLRLFILYCLLFSCFLPFLPSPSLFSIHLSLFFSPLLSIRSPSSSYSLRRSLVSYMMFPSPLLFSFVLFSSFVSRLKKAISHVKIPSFASCYLCRRRPSRTRMTPRSWQWRTWWRPTRTMTSTTLRRSWSSTARPSWRTRSSGSISRTSSKTLGHRWAVFFLPVCSHVGKSP